MSNAVCFVESDYFLNVGEGASRHWLCASHVNKVLSCCSSDFSYMDSCITEREEMLNSLPSG